jgi:hypothetical protein
MREPEMDRRKEQRVHELEAELRKLRGKADVVGDQHPGG